MGEKTKVFSDCDICGRCYWLKDLIKTKRETMGYDYSGKLGDEVKHVIDSRVTRICKVCVEAMDKGKGAQGQLVDEHGFPALRE